MVSENRKYFELFLDGAINLSNGEKLIDLIIENEIGVNKKQFDYFTVDLTFFNKNEEEIEDYPSTEVGGNRIFTEQKPDRLLL
jgi:hypothetical protein